MITTPPGMLALGDGLLHERVNSVKIMRAIPARRLRGKRLLPARNRRHCQQENRARAGSEPFSEHSPCQPSIA